MYTVKPTTKFQKDVKLLAKRGYNIDLLTEVIKKLAKGESLDEKYNDHPLKGNYSGYRECHIKPDWLLIYEISDETLILYRKRQSTDTCSSCRL